MSRDRAIQKLKEHADAFVNHGLAAHSGYWINNFYGQEGERFQRWSKEAYRLIRELEDQDAMDEPRGRT